MGTRSTWRRLRGYPLVLASIVVSYGFTAAQASASPSLVALAAQLLTVAAALHAAGVRRRTEAVGDAALGIVLLVTIAAFAMGQPGTVLAVGLSVAAAAAYLFALVVIIASELRGRRIDARTLWAAVCAYLLIGMFFTYVFSAIALTGGPLFGGREPDAITDVLFFSFTTMTTTGYGNVVPVEAGAQSVAICEAVVGQLFLVTVVARVVTGWERRPRVREDIADDDPGPAAAS